MALPEAIFLGLIVVLSGNIHSVFSTQNVCKTYGSGVFETFNKTVFHLKSTCSITLTHFTHAGVDCHIIVQRGQNGLMNRVEIIVNKVVTLIHNNTLTVGGSRISLPYDHTYQHVFHYGIYTKLRSKVLPLSVTWYNVKDGISSLWVQLDQTLVEGMSGLCGHQNSSETLQRLIFDNILSDGQCLTQDSVAQINAVCRDVLSHAYECLGTKYRTYMTLCYKNMYGLQHKEANCSFFKELSIMCGSSSQLWSTWRDNSKCSQPHCPGDLHYVEMGPAFPPTCTNPQPYPELTSTCQPPQGKVVNDRVDTYYSINLEDCPCVHGKTIYAPGQNRITKCQSCTCVRGKWECSTNTCPSKCIIEGQLITTFDGKQYSLLDRCTYVAARGLNWTLNIQFSGQAVAIEKAYLNINQERYTFSANNVQLNNIEISDLSKTEYATVFWQSSMFIQVQTSFGLKMQLQVSPEIQIYLYLPATETSKGLCGTHNNDTSDDFTTFSGIIENSIQLFAQSWSMDSCFPIPGCINTDSEVFAEESCAQLTDPNGVFALCHDYVPVSSFVDACIQRTCQCSASLQGCLCVSFGNYAKACGTQGITVQDWRLETNCPALCEGNLIFGYATLACNHTCRSLSGPDLTCEVVDDPVEGCGCTPDTHLNNRHTCSPRPLCSCYHPGGVVPPGPVVIGGRQCMCENGQLRCPEECDCLVGKICVHCSQIPVNTAHRTCESLTKPLSEDYACISGCYCPEGFFEDHNGGCVTRENCTCEFSGTVYETGKSVETNCKLCTCRGGEWSCIDQACSGECEVFGNGQYRTFDSKWYRFDGHCQYTLVKDASGQGQFTIQTESVPCCDESLTCSRAISMELWGEVSLLLSDMKVTETYLSRGTQSMLTEPLYYIHIVGLYVIISVPTLGLTVIWDKHTRVTIQLESQWRGRVLGLCGNFDGKVTNDLLTSSSSEVFSVMEFGNSWKTAAPPCSDVTTEMFPCERHSYCAAWAQRRCMILRSDTFNNCHLKVDPEPYYQACVVESCSCEFEGKFLGFCTAVAAYAEACSAKDICINWRTPDLCPVYCDYYNEADQYTWHYNSCGQVKTCGTNNHFTGKIEGCYPRCPAEAPYHDENTGKCSTVDNCTCNFMNKVWTPQDEVCSLNMCCKCLEGNIHCIPTSTFTPTNTINTSTAQPSTTTMLPTTKPLTTERTTLLHTTTRNTTQPPLSEKTTGSHTTEYIATTHHPTSKRTTEYTTTTTERTTASSTTPVEHTTTTQPLTSGRTTEYTTTTERSTELYTTTVEHTTTTEPPASEKTTEPTTTAMERTTELYTTSAEHTTEPSSLETTTKSHSTPKEHTTTTQPLTSEGTTELYTTPAKHTNTTETPTSMRTTTSFLTPVKPTNTTEQPTSETTTKNTTTVTEKTTEFYSTPIEHTTTTQPPSSETTTKSYSTPTEQTTTTQPPTSESTTEFTTTIEPPTSVITTESHSTPMEQTTTTEPPTSERTTEITTTTTEKTTKLNTTPVEHTTTIEPPTSVITTESHSTPMEQTTTTEPPTSERTREITTTTTEKTTKLNTTSVEHTTTTEPPNSVITPKTYSTPKEHTTTTQTPSSETTTEHTTTVTEKTTEFYSTPIEHTTTTQPQSSETTTKSYSTPTEQTTTTQPPTPESTTEFTTTIEPPTSVITTESHSTPMEQTTTTEPPTSERTTEITITTTEKTTKLNTTPVEHTTTTEPPNSVITPKTYSTPKEHTTTTQTPTSETTTEHTTSATERTTEWFTTAEEPTTATQPVSSTKIKYTTQPPTPTTESYTSMKYTTITQPTTVEHTTQEPNATTEKSTTLLPPTTTMTQSTTLEKSTEPPTTKKKYKSTGQPTTEIVKTTPVSTVTTTDFTVITGPTISSGTAGPQISSTTMSPDCRDVLRNQSWPNGATWRENCADKVCKAGVIEVKPITCPTLLDRTDCPRDMKSLVKDKNTCCESWQCDCQCQLYGDPHYISFQGVSFDFMDNCTYTLVEEKVLLHNLSVTGDNYFCEPDIDASCSKGITIKYWNDKVTLMVTEKFTVESTLNQENIKPPYENDIFKFESNGLEVSIYIKPIRSYVSLTPFNTLLINLAGEHFLNNTQGQCGVCGGQSCIRRNGIVEENSCCDKTAYDWVVEDPLKPYCKSPLRNVPCIFPPPMPPPPPCIAPICDLLHHDVFAECSESIDLVSVKKNCRFDHCSSTTTVGACSSLEYAASACKTIGICVDWRYLTNGSCEVSCPEGMIYDECRQSPNDICQGGIPVPATSLVGISSGCFCPDGQILAEEHKQICVSECTTCKGPLGEPMPVGAVWESNCHICTCNNQTKTEECHPKPPTASPMCSSYSLLVSDCCNNQICVEKTCEYNGYTYKVGDRWADPLHPCESFSCSQKGTEIERTVCPEQTCAEDLRIWDKHHCCYLCNTTCAARLTQVNLTDADCTQEVELPSCEGQCDSQNRWVQSNGTLQLEKGHQCCKESAYEMREITVTCNKRPPTHFTYRHVMGCECKSES